jgi:hypothetical protein
VRFDVEAVEKVPKQISGRDAEKSDLIECATINDLMLGKGQEGSRRPPKTSFSLVKRIFPTGSVEGRTPPPTF